jgi:hypothetical protein
MGRMNPSSRGVFPREAFFLAPEKILPGAWRTDSRRDRERYAPHYAPRIEALEVQQARFRRGEELLLVLGWDPESGLASARDAEIGVDLKNARDLTPVMPPDWVVSPARLNPDGSAVAAFRAPGGGYLLSVEVLDREAKRAWRARHGVEHSALPRAVVEISDLLLLRPEGGEGAPAALPGSAGGREVLEDVLTRALPGRRLEERVVEVAWEVYGLAGMDESLRFRVLAAPEGSTFLERAARFLRILDREPTVELSWEERLDGGNSAPISGPLFRRIRLDLSGLPPGPARLTLSVELPGRSPTTSEILLEIPR